jgi:hypothetical protein
LEWPVTDRAVFESDLDVVAAVAEAIASLLDVEAKNVEILDIITTSTEPQVIAARRLGKVDHTGKVKVDFRITDPKNKLKPEDVPKIAPKLAPETNKKLAKKGVKARVGPVKIAVPTKKVTTDPCAVVVKPPVAPPVAPANPCAPVVQPAAPANPCAPVVPAAARLLQEILV